MLERFIKWSCFQKIPIGYSDHDLIWVEINANVPKKLQDRTITYRDYRKLRSNPSFFVSQLNKIDWSAMLIMDDIDDMEKFYNMMDMV